MPAETKTHDATPTKRFRPAYKKASAVTTFPEIMMNLMNYATERNKTEKDFCIAWAPDGKSFVIHNRHEFTSMVIPKFFGASTKFKSFTRKLYQWGFRQLNRGIHTEERLVFGHQHFQRDHADLLVHMIHHKRATNNYVRKKDKDLLQQMVKAIASSKKVLEAAEKSPTTPILDDPACHQDQTIRKHLPTTARSSRPAGYLPVIPSSLFTTDQGSSQNPQRTINEILDETESSILSPQELLPFLVPTKNTTTTTFHQQEALPFFVPTKTTTAFHQGASFLFPPYGSSSGLSYQQQRSNYLDRSRLSTATAALSPTQGISMTVGNWI